MLCLWIHRLDVHGPPLHRHAPHRCRPVADLRAPLRPSPLTLARSMGMPAQLTTADSAAVGRTIGHRLWLEDALWRALRAVCLRWRRRLCSISNSGRWKSCVTCGRWVGTSWHYVLIVWALDCRLLLSRRLKNADIPLYTWFLGFGSFSEGISAVSLPSAPLAQPTLCSGISAIRLQTPSRV